MFRWIHRPVTHDTSTSVRNEIARCVRALRAACFGRSCLARCARRLTAAAPVRRSRCAGAAAVAALLLLGPVSLAEVTCTWNGQEYVCSGVGSSVRVVGGGLDGGDSVVTNYVGVCTNCVAMTPQYVHDWKIEALKIIGTVGSYDGLLENARNAVTYAQVIQSYLAAYTNTYPVSGLNTSSANRVAVTNFVDSTPGVKGSKPYDAAVAAYSSYPPPGSDTNARRWISAYDGAAIAYNDVANSAGSAVYAAHDIEIEASNIQGGLVKLSSMVQNLSEEECSEQAGEGGDGGSLTNQVSGNWCTYDQGEAIKTLLSEIDEWVEKQVDYLDAISNRVVSIDDTIRSALFTTYDHIPTEEDLGTTWQDLYLSGYNDNFPDYASTSIVARIELLLAGISGVLTNSNDYASQDDFAEAGLDSTNTIYEAFGDFTNDFSTVMQSSEASTRSVGDALISLYQKFRTWSGTPFSTENIINSYSVEFESGKSIDVPGFSASAQTLPWANLLRVLCRSAMTVIWILMTVAVFVRFQIAFFQWCFRYVKWAVEILQGLFV